MKFGMLWLSLAVGLLGSCASRQVLEVRSTHLRDLEVETDQEPMIRGEQRKRFYGAIGVREQEQRLGYYYMVQWNEDSTGQPAQVVFEYQQAGTASRVKRMVKDFGPGESSGRAEFRVIGDDYIKGGRVLAWRCRLLRGGREVASRQSYLWQ